MRYLVIILFLFSGCTAYNAITEAAKKANETITAAKETVAAAEAAVVAAKTEWASHKEAADTNRDGSLSIDEIIAYLTLLLGGGAVMVRNAKSDARKTITEQRLDALERKK